MTGYGILASIGLALGGATMTAHAESYADLAGQYRLAELNGVTVAGRVELEVTAEGPWRGRGPCNGFGFTQTGAYPDFHAGPIRATKRACPELTLENAVLAALQSVTVAEATDDLLLLTGDADQRLLFRLEPQ